MERRKREKLVPKEVNWLVPLEEYEKFGLSWNVVHIRIDQLCRFKTLEAFQLLEDSLGRSIR